MGCKYVCDGCGKDESAIVTEMMGKQGVWGKPTHWLRRFDSQSKQIYDVCSRECAEKINAKIGQSAAIVG